MDTTPTLNPGDVIWICKNGNRRRLEITSVHADLEMVAGRIPYASTYVKGGQYEGSYRGETTAWFSQIEQSGA